MQQPTDRRSVRPGDAPGLTPDTESVSRARERQVLYGPDGRVAGMRERELWTVVRRPGLTALPHRQAGGFARWIAGLLGGIIALWAQLLDLWWFCFGFSLILCCAVAGGYLTHSLGLSAPVGFFTVLFLVWLGFTREST